jgi:uncharacterized membrane protein YccC
MHALGISLACPEGAPSCNDVYTINALLLFFPFGVLFAFVIAWPLRRLVLRQRRVGTVVAAMSAALYVYFSGNFPVGVLVAFAVGTIGLALFFGTRVKKPDPATTR